MKYRRYKQEEKMEIIKIVEGSELGVKPTLKELNIHSSTFYKWYGVRLHTKVEYFQVNLVNSFFFHFY